MTSQGARRQGVLHGLGRLVVDDNNTKVGLFRHGRFESGYSFDPTTMEFGDYNKFGNLVGEGFRLTIYGELLVGYFVKGQLSGPGIMKCHNTVYCGYFNNNSVVYGIQYNSMSSSVYCGFFDNFQPHGSGTLVTDLGVTQGNWDHGTLSKYVTNTNNILHQQLCVQPLAQCSVTKLLKQVLKTTEVEKYVPVDCIYKARDYVQRYTEVYPHAYCPTVWYPVPVCSKGIVSFLPDGSVYMPSSKEFGVGVFLFPPGHYYSHFIEHSNRTKPTKGNLYTVDGIRISAMWNENGFSIIKIKGAPDHQLAKLLQMEQIESTDHLLNTYDESVTVYTYTHDEFDLFVLHALYNDQNKRKVGYHETNSLFVIAVYSEHVSTA